MQCAGPNGARNVEFPVGIKRQVRFRLLRKAARSHGSVVEHPAVGRNPAQWPVARNLQRYAFRTFQSARKQRGAANQSADGGACGGAQAMAALGFAHQIRCDAGDDRKARFRRGSADDRIAHADAIA